MKLAASNIAWSPEEDDAVARILSAAGAQGVEVAPGKLFGDPGETPDREVEAARRIQELRDIVLLGQRKRNE